MLEEFDLGAYNANRIVPSLNGRDIGGCRSLTM